MTAKRALEILRELNEWRRGTGRYEFHENPVTNEPLPFTAAEIGQAIDVACVIMDKVVNLK